MLVYQRVPLFYMALNMGKSDPQCPFLKSVDDDLRPYPTAEGNGDSQVTPGCFNKVPSGNLT